jgi:hypothetical protein
MSEPDFDPIDAVNLLRTMQRHITVVQRGMQSIAHEIERRGLIHDDSKFSDQEFPGFARINHIARMHPYGSAEYRSSMKAEKATIERHYSENSHHPENHDVEHLAQNHGFYGAEIMGWLDIIEMVCDWRSAYLTYGSEGTWEENLLKQRLRYEGWFSPAQWWLVEQVSAFIVSKA